MQDDDLDPLDRDDLDSLDIVERVMALEEAGSDLDIDPSGLDGGGDLTFVRKQPPKRPSGSSGATAKLN